MRLKATGATIWCTDTNGTIDPHVSANGKLTGRVAASQRCPSGHPT